ncbi:tetratricopeptide repeat protein [Desulfofundulus thermosubterraneus]|uniref:Tetratricopeptide repeat-containing protein n=1 Tax=Desulfofundulus thermosubterraneus DSM 16057 TaxID=1121432 RepID=A0A1M6FQ53_9FIRM|nr:tetratricopeptide repeat protein [Desulfofundulus thermosubterraneus]SHI99898.1 Tetratricopeptide repeat-containing protein [Desulfofundulus thermosubterraneus DSM 16057]
MKVNKAEELVSKGREFLEKGDFRAAEKAFAAALEEDDAVPTRNNLALAVFMAGEPRRSLEILEPYLDPEKEDAGANPFTYALAARIYRSLGQEVQARRRLQQAVRSFEEGLSELRRSLGQVPYAFREYTVTIMQAAADLRDHRQVFELYRRWESYHVSWENKFLAAVACFNLDRYKRAATLWSSIAQVSRLFSGMQQVAFLVERGVIPPFEMGYERYSQEKMQEMIEEAAASEEARRRYAQDGFFRMMLLAWLLEGDNSKNAAQGVYTLVYYGGEWGEKLGRQVLEYPGFSPSLKIAAVDALMARGILREGEPVPMFIDGERRLVKIKKTPVLMEPDQELDKIVDRAIKLRDEGKIDGAVELLQGIYREGKLYPRAMMTLANLLRQRGELEEALHLMEMLEEIDPDNPVLLFNLSSLMLEMGEIEKAREYFDRIDGPEFEKEFAEKLKILEREIERYENVVLLPEMIMHAYEEDERRKIEEKPLSVDASLARGLKNMPAHWLEGACRHYGLEPARHRRQREEQLREFLSRRDNLEKEVGELEEEERELLKYLLQRGGWSRLNAITRKFGSLEGDGFFWQEREPESFLGFLWSLGLVMVGKATLEGRRVKIATIPLELRQPLKEILGI